MTQTFVNIYDRDRKKVAVLQNAHGITEAKKINQIYTLDYDLPESDEKLHHCQPFYYVRYGDDTQLYRITRQSRETADTGTAAFTCEHAITTLCDTLLFGSYTYGGTGTKTRKVINWLLNKQPVKNWQLGECDFDAAFEYCWEEENLLNALYSVPKPFTDPYIWTFDCSSYPWTINLKKINTAAIPEFYIRAKKNLLSSGVSSDHTEICTRIYPLGYGEGVNQLTIKEVNGGVPYLQAPADVVAEYGIIERVLVDRSFESADTLKAYGQTMLDQLSSPRYERTFDVVDLYPITGTDIDRAEVGKICRLTGDGSTVYITETVRVLDDPGNLRISLSNKSDNVADTIADLADRVRIESVYAQGATQLYQHSKDANATTTKGMVLSLYFPQEMKQINKVLLKIELSRFRAYSQTTASGGGSSATSSSGGGSTATSSSGGGSTATSSSGGGTGSTGASTGAGSFSASAQGTSSAVWDNDTEAILTTWGSWATDKQDGSGLHYHNINNPVTAFDRKELSHSHGVTVNLSENQTSHSHSFSLSAHTHNVTIPTHTHNVTIPTHTHSVTIPDHTHAITPGIFESSENPTAFDIYVGSKKKTTVNSKSWSGDITAWLLNDKNLIPRDSWIKVEIRPNTLAYVISSVFVQGFVQSRGGGNY